MADTYVKVIEGHKVKDEEARTNISTLTSQINSQNTKINEQTAKLNEHSAKLTELEALSHLRPVYDATNESITFQ